MWIVVGNIFNMIFKRMNPGTRKDIETVKGRKPLE